MFILMNSAGAAYSVTLSPCGPLVGPLWERVVPSEARNRVRGSLCCRRCPLIRLALRYRSALAALSREGRGEASPWHRPSEPNQCGGDNVPAAPSRPVVCGDRTDRLD